MTRNKVQPYIVPNTELADVVGVNNGNLSRSIRKSNYESQGQRIYERKSKH